MRCRPARYSSRRRAESFLSVHQGSIPDSLIESELFGHVKGAFSGADRDREGVLVQADRGTLFFDGIGDMSADVQTKLLRVLEDGIVSAAEDVDLALLAELARGYTGSDIAAPAREAALAALVAIAAYTALTGASPTVVRAAIMGGLFVGATLAGRPTSALPSIALAAASKRALLEAPFSSVIASSGSRYHLLHVVGLLYIFGFN
ncbi:MAG: ComEC/Rec2 family competence protein [Proteobacteria bacterium]|nr:ComEC/Rec2 family competence protein [Pseudomonadota bacterium]